MKSIILSATLLLFLASCKKDEPDKNDYNVYVVNNRTAMSYTFTLGKDEQTIKTTSTAKGQPSQFGFNSAEPRRVTIKVGSLPPGDTLHFKYIENGVEIEGGRVVNEKATPISGYVYGFFLNNN